MIWAGGDIVPRRFRAFAGGERLLVSEGVLAFKSVPAAAFADRPAVRRNREHRMEYWVAKVPVGSESVDIEILGDGNEIVASRRFGLGGEAIEVEVEVR